MLFLCYYYFFFCWFFFFFFFCRFCWRWQCYVFVYLHIFLIFLVHSHFHFHFHLCLCFFLLFFFFLVFSLIWSITGRQKIGHSGWVLFWMLNQSRLISSYCCYCVYWFCSFPWAWVCSSHSSLQCIKLVNLPGNVEVWSCWSKKVVLIFTRTMLVKFCSHWLHRLVKLSISHKSFKPFPALRFAFLQI